MNNWTPVTQPPPVPEGGFDYYLVLIEGKPTAREAWYFNRTGAFEDPPRSDENFKSGDEDEGGDGFEVGWLFAMDDESTDDLRVAHIPGKVTHWKWLPAAAEFLTAADVARAGAREAVGVKPGAVIREDLQPDADPRNEGHAQEQPTEGKHPSSVKGIGAPPRYFTQEEVKAMLEQAEMVARTMGSMFLDEAEARELAAADFNTLKAKHGIKLD